MFRNYIYFFVALQTLNCFSQTETVYKEIINDTVYFNFINNEVVPIEVYNEVSSLKHSSIIVKPPTLVKINDTLLKLISVPKNVLDTITNDVFSRYVKIKFSYGDKSHSKHDNSYLYSLPFEMGKKYKVGQSFNGKVSHQTVASKYAMDFNMPIGTPIHASREGIVVYILDHFKKSGGKELINQANKIVIAHNDGTFAAYSHLNYKGVLVKKGDVITKGQHIGYSGNTGYSGGPHLHFAVRDASDVGVPIYFEGYKGVILKKGKVVERLK